MYTTIYMAMLVGNSIHPANLRIGEELVKGYCRKACFAKEWLVSTLVLSYWNIPLTMCASLCQIVIWPQKRWIFLGFPKSSTTKGPRWSKPGTTAIAPTCWSPAPDFSAWPATCANKCHRRSMTSGRLGRSLGGTPQQEQSTGVI